MSIFQFCQVPPAWLHQSYAQWARGYEPMEGDDEPPVDMEKINKDVDLVQKTAANLSDKFPDELQRLAVAHAQVVTQVFKGLDLL